ncbi:tetratricopeptide repeat protein [Chroococcus sp. FPU101]
MRNQKIKELKHKEAIENFTKVLRIKSDFAEAYSKRGIAKLKLQEEL